jgi:MtN3 and saliva related transmembrane protein
MDWIEFMGHVGAFLTSVTFIPQVYKVWKSRSANDLSMSMMLIVVTSTIVWLVYAIALVLWPVILANGIVLFLSLMLIYFKLTFKKVDAKKTSFKQND